MCSELLSSLSDHKAFGNRGETDLEVCLGRADYMGLLTSVVTHQKKPVSIDNLHWFNGDATCLTEEGVLSFISATVTPNSFYAGCMVVYSSTNSHTILDHSIAPDTHPTSKSDLLQSMLDCLVSHAMLDGDNCVLKVAGLELPDWNTEFDIAMLQWKTEFGCLAKRIRYLGSYLIDVEDGCPSLRICKYKDSKGGIQSLHKVARDLFYFGDDMSLGNRMRNRQITSAILKRKTVVFASEEEAPQGHIGVGENPPSKPSKNERIRRNRPSSRTRSAKPSNWRAMAAHTKKMHYKKKASHGKLLPRLNHCEHGQLHNQCKRCGC
jgi:hypothetical protein